MCRSIAKVLSLLVLCMLSMPLWSGDAGAKPSPPVRTPRPGDENRNRDAVWIPIQVELTKPIVYTTDKPPKDPELGELEQRDSITQNSITWTFDKKVPVGRFVNGDWYVVGPVTVVKLDPKPLRGTEIPDDQLVLKRGQAREGSLPRDKLTRNGSMLNQPARAPREVAGKGYPGEGFDSRIGEGRYDPDQFTPLPISMKPGDSLCSSISAANDEIDNWGANHIDCVKIVCVLTCLDKPQPPDAFRPSYALTSTSKIYLARNLKREIFLNLTKPAIFGKPNDAPNIQEHIRSLQLARIDIADFGNGAPKENYAPFGIYGDVMALNNGTSALLLCLDYKPEEKEPLIINMVQAGIDFWGLARGGRKWDAHGGLHSGRKFPILLAGLLLNEPELLDPEKAGPRVRFQEDDQTAMCPVTYNGVTYQTGWTGSKAVFMGHSITREDNGANSNKGSWPDGLGPVDLFHPKDWPARPSVLTPGLAKAIGSENYRRCCTSRGWVSQALFFRMLHLEKIWNHDAYFAYCDRWMTEDDEELNKIIAANGAQDYSKGIKPKGTSRQGNPGNAFVGEMWAKYRNNLPPAADGHRDPSDTESWK